MLGNVSEDGPDMGSWHLGGLLDKVSGSHLSFELADGRFFLSLSVSHSLSFF